MPLFKTSPSDFSRPSFQSLLSTQPLQLGNLFLCMLRSINLWWTVKGMRWDTCRFPSFLIELPPDIQQTASDVMISADLGGILLAFLQQLHHLQLELP